MVQYVVALVDRASSSLRPTCTIALSVPSTLLITGRGAGRLRYGVNRAELLRGTCHMEGYVWQDIAGHVKSSPRLTDINLTELQKTLDAQGIELVENQKESVVGRKALADRTKGVSCTCVALAYIDLRLVEFKKIPDEEKLNAFKGLLKGELPATCIYYGPVSMTFI